MAVDARTGEKYSRAIEMSEATLRRWNDVTGTLDSLLVKFVYANNLLQLWKTERDPHSLRRS